MSTLINLRQCPECKTTSGTGTCARCRIHLSLKKELPRRFDEHLSTHKTLLNRLLNKAEPNECSRKVILSQIDQWENKIIERIRYKAELARQQLDCFIPKNDQTITNDAQALRKEMRKKKKKNDFVGHDLERVQMSIVHILAELKKLKRSVDVELYTEPNHMIDWNHLIFVREKSNKMMSTLVNEQPTNDDEEENRIASNQNRKSSSSESESESDESNSDNESRPCEQQFSHANISNNRPAIRLSRSEKIPLSVFLSCNINSAKSSSKTEVNPLSSQVNFVSNTTRPSTTTETEQQNDSLYKILQRMRRQREDDKT